MKPGGLQLILLYYLSWNKKSYVLQAFQKLPLMESNDKLSKGLGKSTCILLMKFGKVLIKYLLLLLSKAEKKRAIIKILIIAAL